MHVNDDLPLALVKGGSAISFPASMDGRHRNISYIVFELKGWFRVGNGCKTLSYECIEALRKTHFHAVRPNRSLVIRAKNDAWDLFTNHRF